MTQDDVLFGYSGLRRELDTYLRLYNHDRVHHGRLTQGPIPANIVYRTRSPSTAWRSCARC